jgi:hypothetical protein
MENDDLVTFTEAERAMCAVLSTKDEKLRDFLSNNRLDQISDPRKWLAYFAGIRSVLGNLSNDVSFVSTLLVKEFLFERFSIRDFDAARKPQGAPGIDIEARTAEGHSIVGELKTTTPYQPGFGAAQRTSILKDISRLSKTKADYRFMFVIDADSYRTICSKSFASRMLGVEVVNLVTKQTFVCQE